MCECDGECVALVWSQVSCLRHSEIVTICKGFVILIFWDINIENALLANTHVANKNVPHQLNLATNDVHLT